MTRQARTLIDALLMDLKHNPDTPPRHAAAAIITATRHAGFDLVDFREMMAIMRAEYGIGKPQWEAMLLELLAEVPGAGNVQDLARLD